MLKVPQTNFEIVTDKKRRFVQMASPIPIIPGKATVIIKGETARFRVTEERPNFYLRLSKEERFGIVRVTPKKNERVVENLSIIPVAQQTIQDRKQMETFEQQLAEGLYRIWPEKPLTPGEYALIQFSEESTTDDIELLIWDFTYKPVTQ